MRRIVLGGPVETMVYGVAASGQQPRSLVGEPVRDRRGHNRRNTNEVPVQRKNAQPIDDAALRAADDATGQLRCEKSIVCDGLQDRNVALSNAKGGKSAAHMFLRRKMRSTSRS